MAHVTLKDVSQAAGVSVQTVSQVLNARYRSLYHPQTRQRVIEAARRLGYRPNAAARAMLNRRSNIIGVLVPIIPHGWFFQLDVFETMLGMNQRLAQEGYVTSVIPVRELEAGHSGSRAFREQMLDGVVVIGWVPDSVAKFVEEVAPVCIWCDTDADRPQGCIRRDEFHAGRLVAQKVIEQGYKRILWLTYAEPNLHYSSRDRRRGIEQEAQRHGISVEAVHARRAWIDDDNSRWARLLDPQTAVLTENMHFAQSLANLVQPLGLAPGRDFGLAACDHSNERAAVFPTLSRAMFDRSEVGLQAGEMLMSALQTGKLPPSRTVQAEWYEGTTTRRSHENTSTHAANGNQDASSGPPG